MFYFCSWRFCSIKQTEAFFYFFFRLFVRMTVTSKFFYIFRPLAVIHIVRKYLQRCKLAVESAANFSWFSRRRPSRLHEILIFFRIFLAGGRGGEGGKGGSGDIMADCMAGRWFEYRRKMHNCLKFKCRCCCDRSNQPVLMYHVSSCRCVRYIIGWITGSCVRVYAHARVSVEFEMRWIIAVLTQHERSRDWDHLFAKINQCWNPGQKTISL